MYGAKAGKAEKIWGLLLKNDRPPQKGGLSLLFEPFVLQTVSCQKH
jgi:hypothetical protein